MRREPTREERDLIRDMGDANVPLVMPDASCPHSYLRAQHAKSHGCLKATFAVRADLAPHFQKGIFKPGAVYAGVARFSAGTQFDDSKDDAHGLALQLEGVNPDGAPAWVDDDAKAAGVQDFVMMNRDTFPFYETREYERINDVMCATFLGNRSSASDNALENSWGKLRGYGEALMDIGLDQIVRGLGRLLGRDDQEEKEEARNSLLKSVALAAHFGEKPLTYALKENYWGTQPYALGDPSRVVRYVLRRPDVRPQFPAPGKDAIRARLAVDAREPQHFEFCIIQRPRWLEGKPDDEVLDCRTPWACDDPGKQNPDNGAWEMTGDPWHDDVVPVADVVIHDPEAAEALASADPKVFGPFLGQERAFTPWHALADHEPLGEINAARRDVYARLSKLRLQKAEDAT